MGKEGEREGKGRGS